MYAIRSYYGQVRHQHALGHFELEPAAVDAVVLQRRLQPRDVGVAQRQLGARDVDREPQRLAEAARNNFV